MTNNGFTQPEVKLSDLYQEVILDHNRRPRNFGKLENATHYAHGVNPLCGDNFHLYLVVDKGGIIEKVAFEGSGCAISKSSASMMTSAIEKKNIRQVEHLDQAFIHLLTKDKVADEEKTMVGTLKIFEGVKNYPIRVKCATLIWRALEAALKEDPQKKEVSTE